MTITYGYLFPLLLIVFTLFLLSLLKQERYFFSWVKANWFFRRNFISKLSTAFFLAGIFILLLSLLDFRGEEIRIKSNIPQQRTIILIDVSASMLVEDVRPNRFSRALLVARHFVKRAAGHQISLLIFSDVTKRVAPFTDDVDLLDARIATLKKLNLQKGGSNLSSAILESVQYFKMGTEKGEVSGNLLVLTDAEETTSGVDIKLGDSVSLAIVGIGTRSGGPIPLRDRYGILSGYKKHNGKQVNSILDEDFIKKIGRSVKSYKWWVAHSYSIPTDEILLFFGQIHKEKYKRGDIVIKPVLMPFLLIPAIILLMVSYVLKIFPPFLLASFLALGLCNIQAESTSTHPLYEKFKKGDVTQQEKLKLAEILLREKKHKEALVLYQETFGNRDIEMGKSLMNYATALLANGKTQAGLQIYAKILDHYKRVGGAEQIINNIRQNTLHALEIKRKQKKRSQQQGQKGNNSQKNRQQQKNSKGKPNKKKQQQNKQNSNQKQENMDKQYAKRRRKINVPAILKQIENEDRKLQGKLLDTKIYKKTKYKKDW